jgi:5-methylcytosine-specific restriction protein A
MDSIKKIVYTNLTDAEFFNLNKPPKTENKGGGQGYIDFSTSMINVAEWVDFFSGVNDVTETTGAQGPRWMCPVYNIGIDDGVAPNQNIEIYQRRSTSITISSQKLLSRRTNRLKAWHPENGFPKPIDITIRNQCPTGLMVYLALTYEGKLWAGWYLNDSTSTIPYNGAEPTLFGKMFSANPSDDEASGMLSFDQDVVLLDVEDRAIPFKSGGQQIPVPDVATADPDVATAEEVESELNSINKLFEDDVADTDVVVTEQVIKIRKRNTKIVKKLKELYGHNCQISGDEFAFQKKNGINYTEAHHLVPLGSGGADAPNNLVVLSPLLHRMLHHADVSPINLDDIVINGDGGASLDIMINTQKYIINWHPAHAALFAK